MRAFHENMSNMLIAYAVGSAVEGFSTLASKCHHGLALTSVAGESFQRFRDDSPEVPWEAAVNRLSRERHQSPNVP